MAIRETLDTLHLCWLSKPKGERGLYRTIGKRRIRSIVELGLQHPERSLRLIRMARRCSPRAEVLYGGIDLFDARPSDQLPLTLKSTHQLLSGSGATIRLIPGDALSALARMANQLQQTQLLVISPNHDAISMAQAWRYIPRMLSPDGIVLQAVGHGSETQLHLIPDDQIQTRASTAERRPRAA